MSENTKAFIPIELEDQSNLAKVKIETAKLEKIGSFAAYIRKNLNSQHGIRTQFFGEDGEDADIISVLSQTRFKGLEVGLTIYWIKNGLGLSMKDEATGRYPIITSFIGTINRPKPSSHDDGMVAEFFVEDGENSDKANILNESKYKDSLVFVDIRGKFALDNPNIYEDENQENISENHAWKVSEKEKREYQKSAKRFLKINVSLHDDNGDVFLNSDVFNTINQCSDEYISFYDFVKQESCVFKHGGHLCKNTDGISVLDIGTQQYLPFCHHHKDIMEEAIATKDYSCVDHKAIYLETQYLRLVQKWVWGYFIKTCSLTGHEEPNSLLILSWFEDHGLLSVLPQKFRNDVATKLLRKL